jgi:ParB family chromosome partitioning protein
MRFDLDALIPAADATAQVPAGEGTPLQLDVDAIDEDPHQPRREFDAEPMRELAASIAERGVLQAISVRRHPDREGRWILNFGARRLRASMMAGHPRIPAFINEAPNSYDQVIENEQREGLKPLELALFVQRQLAHGESQTDIARKMGKSRAYVTYALAMIDAPDCLLTAYREGRCRGLRELYELRRLHEAEPEVVEQWLADSGSVTRAELRDFKGSLPDANSAPSTPAAPTASVPASKLSATHAPPLASAAAPATHPTARMQPDRRVTLWGTYDGAAVVIDLSDVPEDEGRVFVRRDDGGKRLSVPASLVQLSRVALAAG